MVLKVVSAVSSRREVSKLFNRVAIMILLYSGHYLAGIGIYNGLFHLTIITHSFDLFIGIIGVIVLFFSVLSDLFFGLEGNSTDLVSILLSVIPARAVTPIVVYSNADTQKVEIIKENRGKSGVYR
jgi:hypothetical protein